MKHLLNTLFVTTQGSYLAREGDCALVRVERETKLRLPVHGLGGIVCFGQVSVSPPLMELCAENGVLISFLSEQGKFISRVQGPVSGNVLLRREQYRIADDPERTAAIARSVVIGKIGNCRTVLMRAARDNPDLPGTPIILIAVKAMARQARELKGKPLVDVVRGIEGEAAKTYFGIFDHLITMQKDAFFFKGRNRRPPLDNVNAMLSFVYTLLAHDAQAALEGVGLDPAVGYLHAELARQAVAGA